MIRASAVPNQSDVRRLEAGLGILVQLICVRKMARRPYDREWVDFDHLNVEFASKRGKQLKAKEHPYLVGVRQPCGAAARTKMVGALLPDISPLRCYRRSKGRQAETAECLLRKSRAVGGCCGGRIHSNSPYAPIHFVRNAFQRPSNSLGGVDKWSRRGDLSVSKTSGDARDQAARNSQRNRRIARRNDADWQLLADCTSHVDAYINR